MNLKALFLCVILTAPALASAAELICLHQKIVMKVGGGARAFSLHAGPRASAHLRKHGLRPEHVACVPAAAGGPKGLALVPLDKWLFGDWLANAPRVELIGAFTSRKVARPFMARVKIRGVANDPDRVLHPETEGV